MFSRLIEQKNTREDCYLCDKPITPNVNGRFVAYVRGLKRKGIEYREVWLNQCCEYCAEIELATIEAQEECRRFTDVGLGTEKYDGYHGKRCACGAASLPSYGWCVWCWRDVRMLNKEEADIRFNRKLLKQLKESFKNVNN